MILTGSKIKEEVTRGTIRISPFSEEQVNPNSYNYRLGAVLKCYKSFDGDKSLFEEVLIPEDGYTLQCGQMYLGHTKEIIGSSIYAMSLIGRSSMGRYGLFLQVSANLGHTTSEHQWTLEIVATRPIRVYPGMVIGQVSFWRNLGRVVEYDGLYGQHNQPQESLVPDFD
jgi:dCTP deaminase